MSDPAHAALPLALVRANGQLVALLATVLSRAGLLSVEEFAAMLGAYAASIGESTPVEGQILAAWAAAVSDLAAGPDLH